MKVYKEWTASAEYTDGMLDFHKAQRDTTPKTLTDLTSELEKEVNGEVEDQSEDLGWDIMEEESLTFDVWEDEFPDLTIDNELGF